MNLRFIMKRLRMMKVQFLFNRLRIIYRKKILLQELIKREFIFLYAGDIPQNGRYKKFVGLSLSQENSQHIKHDVTKTLPFNDSSVDIYQSEDVFEHLALEALPEILNDIYRVLKTGGIFRLSLPDYRCDILRNRALRNEAGQIIFDPGGGGELIDGKVTGRGHLWFPVYDTVKELLNKTKFERIYFYHYYEETGRGVTNPIDYSIGHIHRTPDHDRRVKNPHRPMSIVVDCIK